MREERRDNFPHLRPIGTRWKDNDVYGHVNNVEYYSFFDTVIGGWLMGEGGLDHQHGPVYGLCVESHCAYFSAVAFPEVVDAGLRVAHVGRSSVRYEIALFPQGAEQSAAGGWFVHVFVSRETGRPAELTARLRDCLERISVGGER